LPAPTQECKRKASLKMSQRRRIIVLIHEYKKLLLQMKGYRFIPDRAFPNGRAALKAFRIQRQ